MLLHLWFMVFCYRSLNTLRQWHIALSQLIKFYLHHNFHLPLTNFLPLSFFKGLQTGIISILNPNSQGARGRYIQSLKGWGNVTLKRPMRVSPKCPWLQALPFLTHRHQKQPEMLSPESCLINEALRFVCWHSTLPKQHFKRCSLAVHLTERSNEDCKCSSGLARQYFWKTWSFLCSQGSWVESSSIQLPCNVGLVRRLKVSASGWQVDDTEEVTANTGRAVADNSLKESHLKTSLKNMPGSV